MSLACTVKMKPDWIDELFEDGQTGQADPYVERRLDSALRLLGTSALDDTESLELDLVDTYLDFDRDDWDRLFDYLKINQLRVVDFYAPSQREISKWVRLIAFNEL